MRILYVTHQFFPEGKMGTERFTLNMARAMQRAGHHVHVAAWTDRRNGFPKKFQGHSVRNYRFERIPVTAFRHTEIEPWDNHFFFGNRLKLFRLADRLLESESFDVIHFSHFMRVSPFAFAALERNIPYVATLTDYFTICHRAILMDFKDKLCAGPEKGMACAKKCVLPQMPEDYVFQRILAVRHVLSNAAAVTCPSRHVAEQVCREHPGLHIQVAPHGVSIQNILDPRQRDYSDSAPIRFGYLGQIHHHKGVHLLIKAFRKVSHPRARLDIYGLAWDNKYALELLALAHGDPRIVFRGPYKSRQELVGILDSLDAVCMPSVWPENHPLVVIEAMARSVPIIGAKIGGIPELVKDGSNGYLFEAGSARDLQSVLTAVANAPESLNALRRGITHVRTVDEEAAQFENLYERAVHEKRQTRTAERPSLLDSLSA